MTRQAPDDLAFGTRSNPGHEQGGCRHVDGAGPAASALAQRPVDQTTAREPLIDRRHAEGQKVSLTLTCAFQLRDLFAQTVEDDVWAADFMIYLQRQPVISLSNSYKFCICSSGVNESMRI